MHTYEVRPRKDNRGVDLISEALPHGKLWYGKVDFAISYVRFYSRSQGAIIRVYDEEGQLVREQTEEATFKEP